VTLTWRCGSRWCSLTDVTASRRRS
jgi:hypothetical protein